MKRPLSTLALFALIGKRELENVGSEKITIVSLIRYFAIDIFTSIRQ